MQETLAVPGGLPVGGFTFCTNLNDIALCKKQMDFALEIHSMTVFASGKTDFAKMHTIGPSSGMIESAKGERAARNDSQKEKKS